MNQVLGNEHSTNPLILISPIAENPIRENISQTSTIALTPSLLESPDDEDAGTTSSFNSGQKTRWKGRNDKSDVLVEMMVTRLEAEEEEKQEKKKFQTAKEAIFI